MYYYAINYNPSIIKDSKTSINNKIFRPECGLMPPTSGKQLFKESSINTTFSSKKII